MSSQEKSRSQKDRQVVTGLERLSLRVSSMINHPVAQIQRWVTVHRLDTDGEREWKEVMGLLSETECIDMTFNDDESVTLRWDPQGEEEQVSEVENLFKAAMEEPAPF
ncbi:DUF1654 domain-containing protein [Pseudomonas sp. PB103]|uniref:DUF1654 domain-containing protein n=1 Tax=Pseudomonas sp. PB103 TaxID=2494698 RepID=UPI00131CFDC5|nr:DUF1654 domain-containing protein [Pseudomonas sp. PB103]KAE9642406.1 DUF1654 domain-containing protein [Pseudomonas sp. PB103]